MLLTLLAEWDTVLGDKKQDSEKIRCVEDVCTVNTRDISVSTIWGGSTLKIQYICV